MDGEGGITFDDLVSMSLDERTHYFLLHPIENADPNVPPLFVVDSRARFVDTIARRDAEQATRRPGIHPDFIAVWSQKLGPDGNETGRSEGST